MPIRRRWRLQWKLRICQSICPSSSRTRFDKSFGADRFRSKNNHWERKQWCPMSHMQTACLPISHFIWPFKFWHESSVPRGMAKAQRTPQPPSPPHLPPPPPVPPPKIRRKELNILKLAMSFSSNGGNRCLSLLTSYWKKVLRALFFLENWEGSSSNFWEKKKPRGTRLGSVTHRRARVERFSPREVAQSPAAQTVRESGRTVPPVHTGPEEFRNATIIGHFGLGQGVTWSSWLHGFRKLLFKMSSFHTKTKRWRFQILRFEERLWKTPFWWRISVDS